MKFNVSIVIPVYKAEKYIRHAVESCLIQDEVGEVILVEDCSPDNSLEVCLTLEKEYPVVRLVRHTGGINLGAGPSRNLGMTSARFPFIAFLDADDYFLKDRFKRTQQVFNDHPDADGVYEAVGIFGDSVEGVKLYSVNKPLPPHSLFHYLLRGTYGHFSTNALTFKKDLLKKTNLFDTTLRLHQDSELWLRMAFHGKLYPGILDTPVTYVRRHENNRIIHANIASRLQFWQVVIDYFKNQPVHKLDYLLILWKYCRIRAQHYDTMFFVQLLKVLGEEPSKVFKVIF